MLNIPSLNKYFLILTLLMITLFYSNDSYADKPLVFNVTGQPPLNTKNHDGFMDEISREALRRIGYKLIINRLPAERGLRSVNKGVIDGEVGRVKGLDETYTNLIRVSEKTMTWDFVVFSAKKINLEKKWLSFENKNIAFINGWKIIENNVPKSARVTKTKNAEQLFMLLNKGRVDYVIYEYWGGHYFINKMGLKNIKVRYPRLVSKDIYMYLNKKHSAIVPLISKTILNMKKDGSYKKIKDQYLGDKYGLHK